MSDVALAGIVERLVARYGLRVLSGPFAGMEYVTQSIGSAFVPKLLGCYEQELHGLLEPLLQKPYRRVINIGCAEGYYAVGLALRLPKTQVYAFDPDTEARQLCEELARKNHVQKRVRIGDACTPDRLEAILKPGSLILCDCEGCELELLDPQQLPALAQCDLLLEMHDYLLPGLSGTMQERFAATHAIQFLSATERDPDTLPRILKSLPHADAEQSARPRPPRFNASEKRLALNEHRPAGMQWALLTAIYVPRTRKAASPRRTKRQTISTSERPGVGITACILARNEEKRIEDALKSLHGWTEQIIVIDNESEDQTVAIARQYGALILTAPRATNFDAARNLAIEHATGEWIFYLDADERVPACLSVSLQKMVREQGNDFEAVCIPFKHYFCDKWMEHSGWWPGYTRPQLLKKGRFRYNERLHSGVEVDGRTYYFPADDPDYAITHYSYDDLEHYLIKLNSYTDGEAESLDTDKQNHSWQAQLAHFVHDWQVYYERGRADLDGMHGFVLAFLSGVYRFLSRAKLWDIRRQRGEASEMEPIPASVQEMLAFMAHVAQQGAGPWLLSAPIQPSATQECVPDAWLTDEATTFAQGKYPRRMIEERSNIAAYIVARNEAKRIEEALQSLQGWVDRIIVIDNDSEDETAEIARRYTPHIIKASHLGNFEEIRLSVAAEIEGLAFEECEWLFHLDADERVPVRLSEILQKLVKERGEEFEGLCVPFQTFFYGKWMHSKAWWPGYKGPQLYKRGHFHFGERIHTGTLITGRTLWLPAEEPDLAIRHDAYDSISHYLTKLNAYTNAEARGLYSDGASHSWQAMLAHFVEDWTLHYDRLEAHRDGMHGFIQAFLCSLYRFVTRAKLWDIRRKQGETFLLEPVPASLHEMLAFMAGILHNGPGEWTRARHFPASRRSIEAGEMPLRTPLLWHGPIFDSSGYAEDGRNLVLACLEAEERLLIAPQTWGNPDASIPESERQLLARHLAPMDTPADIFVSNTLPRIIQPAPNALFHIGRTVFETDRLPEPWIPILKALDRIWVPSEYNRELFVGSGIEPDKIAVIPEVVAPVFLEPQGDPWPLPGQHAFTFLSVFDWMRHKGWDVLLEAFARVFANRPDIGLVIKTWSSSGYTLEHIREQANSFLRERLGKRLADIPNIHLWQEHIPGTEMPRLYQAADCFILPTRGEAWCRPLMEAMAVGLPTIVTAWSGHTTYHNASVGYPLRYTLQPVSPAGAREVPFYAGHRWAEPDIVHLQYLLRYIVHHQEAARKKGQAARKEIALHYTRPAVAQQIRAELAFCQPLIVQKAASNASSALPTANNAILIQSVAGEQTCFLDLTRAHHEAYAHAHRMDYVCRYGAQTTDRAPHWDKILLILLALRKGYEYIIWLDADTLIVNSERDLREALPEDAWMGMVRHDTPGEGQHRWYNSGAIYLRNTPKCLAFFEEVWNAWPIDHHWEDNMAMIMTLGFAPERWEGVAVLSDEWNSTRLMNEHPSAVVKAWHGNGPTPIRLEMMRAEFAKMRSRQEATSRASHAGPPVLPRRPPANPVPLDPIPSVDFRAALGRPLRMRWEGDQTLLSSLALVNRELCLSLLAAGDVELSLFEGGTLWHTLRAQDDPRFGPLFARLNAPLSGPPDVTIRHFYPPDWTRPESGKLIVIQPWELSHLPRYSWVTGACQNADEVWVPSRWVRDSYVRSGVPAEKVKVVPNGVRQESFASEGPCLPLPTQKSFRFLFVGGTVRRKGPDLLLEAYLRAFTRQDDVCLVVKDMGTRTFYQSEHYGDVFRRVQADPRAPEVIYLEDDMSESELAALYRACSCLVLPYRGEGFALPPLEAMACGLATIVTSGGATDDFLDDRMALRVPHHRVTRRGAFTDPDALPLDPWELEPDRKALMDALRWAYERPQETRRRGEAARAYVTQGWTWEHAASKARVHLQELITPQRSKNSSAAVLWKEPPQSAAKTGKRPNRKKTLELSFCMIARNEEARIAYCLQGVAPHVDEMIVVDTGSTDRTREIALECGARVFDFPWSESFAEARNKSLEQARGQWIFWMDADDVLPPECGAQLRELIRRHPERNTAYQMQVRIPPGPGESSHSVVDHVKLFPNRPEFRFEHRIHEQVLPSLRRAGAEVLFSDLYVTHQHYDRSEEGQARKRQRDFRLLALDLADHPDHPFVLFNLGMTYLYATREYEVAAHYLRRSLNGSDWRDSIVRKAYALLTQARIGQHEWTAALAANEEGRGYYPDDAELLYQAGQIYQQQGQFGKAQQALERLLHGHDDPHYRSVEVGLRTYRGQHELALLYYRRGETLSALTMLRQVVAEHPTYQPAQRDLTDIQAHSMQSQGQSSVQLPHVHAVQPLDRSEGLARLAAMFPFPPQRPQVSPQEHGWLAAETADALQRHLSTSTRVVVELGSWLGRSTRFLARCVPQATIIAVDHWLGSEEHHTDEAYRRYLPTLYETFLVNCWPDRERIIPVRLSTLEGLSLLSQLGITPDLIYMDAAHDYQSVRRDLQTALHLFPMTSIVGDDWYQEGVRCAVIDVVQALGLQPHLKAAGNAWWMTIPLRG